MPIVTNPTAGDVHVNRPLTNFSQKFMQDAGAFVGLRAMPNMPVSKQADLYYVFNRGDFYRDEAKERADGAETEGAGFRLSTDPYYARVWGFHKDVTDRQRANQDDGINLDNSATQFVTQKLMIRRERLFQEAYVAPNVWFNGTTAATAGQDVNWVTGDPIVEIRTAITGVHQLTGYRPNRMVMGRQAWDTLMDNDNILARITGGATAAQPAKVMKELLAALFELESIEVMDSVVNSAVRGDDENNAFIAGDDAALYYAPSGVGLDEPTAGVQFSWTGLMGNTPNGMRIRRFRQESRAADRVEGEMSFDYRLTSGALGHFFTAVSS